MYILKSIASLVFKKTIHVFLSVPTWMLQAISKWCLLFSLLCAVNGEGMPLVSVSNSLTLISVYVLPVSATWTGQRVLLPRLICMPMYVCTEAGTVVIVFTLKVSLFHSVLFKELTLHVHNYFYHLPCSILYPRSTTMHSVVSVPFVVSLARELVKSRFVRSNDCLPGTSMVGDLVQLLASGSNGGAQALGNNMISTKSMGCAVKVTSESAKPNDCSEINSPLLKGKTFTWHHTMLWNVDYYPNCF